MRHIAILYAVSVAIIVGLLVNSYFNIQKAKEQGYKQGYEDAELKHLDYVSLRTDSLHDEIYTKDGIDTSSLRLLLIDKNIPEVEIVLAQACLETGWFKSDLCVYHNNIFGLYNSKEKEFFRFASVSECVDKYKKWISSRWEKHKEANPNDDYYEFLEAMNYAESETYVAKLKLIRKKL